MSIENSLKLVVQTGKLVYGHDKSVKNAKEKKAKMLIVAKDCKNKEMLEKNVYLGIPVLHYPGTSVELGRVCGKRFAVGVLAVLDPGTSNILNEKE
jgi:large subunit ribosomal protein L30e